MLNDINYNEVSYQEVREATAKIIASTTSTTTTTTTTTTITTTINTHAISATTKLVTTTTVGPTTLPLVTPNPTLVSRRQMFQQRRADRRDRRKICKDIKSTPERAQCLETIRVEMAERNETRTENQLKAAEQYPPNDK